MSGQTLEDLLRGSGVTWNGIRNMYFYSHAEQETLYTSVLDSAFGSEGFALSAAPAAVRRHAQITAIMTG